MCVWGGGGRAGGGRLGANVAGVWCFYFLISICLSKIVGLVF